MSESKESNDAAEDPSDLVLPEVMDLAHAEDLYDQLQEKLNTGDTIIADASNVKRISTPCVQLLFSAAKTLQNQDKKFQIKHPSDIVQDAFSDLGLEEQLNEWSSAS